MKNQPVSWWEGGTVNVVFWLAVIVVVALLWVTLSMIFPKVGAVVREITKETKENVNADDEDEKSNKEDK